MDELERLGRHALECVWRVAEASWQQTWEALQPVLERLLARWEALYVLLRLVILWLAQIGREVQLRPVFNVLAQAVEAVWQLLGLLQLLFLELPLRAALDGLGQAIGQAMDQFFHQLLLIGLLIAVGVGVFLVLLGVLIALIAVIAAYSNSRR